jgi:hypothetical protein
MTEVEWLASTDPELLLQSIRGHGHDRKLRLFAVGCCRMVLPLLPGESQSHPTASRPRLLAHERRAVQAAEQSLDVIEQYADGLVGWATIVAGYCDVLRLLSVRRPQHEPWAFLLVAILRAASTARCYYGQEWEYDRHDTRQCAIDAADYVGRVGAWAGEGLTGDFKAMQKVEAALARCIFGNPFRPVSLNPEWLQWSDGTVRIMAQAIYEERAFDRLPILADALEEAGCMNADMLGHCRGPGPHAKGCWVVDLLVGKA